MSKIEWTQATWNPVAGCSKISAGCKNCYATGIAHRFAGKVKKFEGTTKNQNTWSGKINFDEEVLLKPLSIKRPTMFFVNSMSDLFHENIPFEWIDKVMAVIALCPQHIFQVRLMRLPL